WRCRHPAEQDRRARHCALDLADDRHRRTGDGPRVLEATSRGVPPSPGRRTAASLLRLRRRQPAQGLRGAIAPRLAYGAGAPARWPLGARARRIGGTRCHAVRSVEPGRHLRTLAPRGGSRSRVSWPRFAWLPSNRGRDLEWRAIGTGPCDVLDTIA